MAAKNTAKTTPESAPKKVEAPLKPVAKKAAVKKAPAKKTGAKPSLDAVARAAYLNYRNRVEKGLPGDSHGDWLEAERQHSALS